MLAVLDDWLLDRVFQPFADGAADWVDCFGLARGFLAAAVALHLIVFADDVRTCADPVVVALAAGITLLALAGAEGTRLLIERVRRQTRPGALNVRRITLRAQRTLWIAAAFVSLCSALPTGTFGGVCVSVGSLCWMAVVYFVSCSPSPPSFRTRWDVALAPT